MHHIGLGRTRDGTRIILLIHGYDVRVIDATTGEIIRTLTINPERRYHGTGKPQAGQKDPEKRTEPDPDAGPVCPRCLATSHGAPGRDRTCDARLRNRPLPVRLVPANP